MVGRHQGCLAAEFEDRNNIIRMLAKFLDQQRHAVAVVAMHTRDCSEKLKALAALESALPKHREMLATEAKAKQAAAREREASSRANSSSRSSSSSARYGAAGDAERYGAGSSGSSKRKHDDDKDRRNRNRSSLSWQDAAGSGSQHSRPPPPLYVTFWLVYHNFHRFGRCELCVRAHVSIECAQRARVLSPS